MCRHAPIAITFVALLLAGCSSGGSDPAPGGEPEPGAAQRALAEAPQALRAIDTGADCGAEVPNFGEGIDRGARRCLADALDEGRPASMVSTLSTVEGDPVPNVFIAGDGLRVITDFTADRFGSQRWTLSSCPDLVRERLGKATALRGRDCSRVTIDERTPSEVVEREPLRYCGRVPPLEPGVLRFTNKAIDCAYDAVEDDERVEIVVGERTEEGPIREYVRILGPGEVEVFTDATRGGTGGPAWYRRTCSRFALEGLDGPRCTPHVRLAPGLTTAAAVRRRHPPTTP